MVVAPPSVAGVFECTVVGGVGGTSTLYGDGLSLQLVQTSGVATPRMSAACVASNSEVVMARESAAVEISYVTLLTTIDPPIFRMLRPDPRGKVGL